MCIIKMEVYSFSIFEQYGQYGVKFQHILSIGRIFYHRYHITSIDMLSVLGVQLLQSARCFSHNPYRRLCFCDCNSAGNRIWVFKYKASDEQNQQYTANH